MFIGQQAMFHNDTTNDTPEQVKIIGVDYSGYFRIEFEDGSQLGQIRSHELKEIEVTQ